MFPEISARWSLLEPRFRYLSPGSEGEKCRPLDHMWQIPFIHSVQFTVRSHFYTYVKVCQLFLPSGTWECVLVLYVFNHCACAFQKHWAQALKRLFKYFLLPNCTFRCVLTQNTWIFYRALSEKEEIRDYLVPAYDIFVFFSLYVSQVQVKTKR